MPLLTLKPKIGKRYSELSEPLMVTVTDCNVLLKKSGGFLNEYNNFYESLQKKGIKILMEEKNQLIEIPEQGLDAELMKKLKEITEVSNRYMLSTQVGGLAVKKVMETAENCMKTKDRINIQQLKDQHALKLLDNLEKEALKTQADYWETKKKYETAFAEFMELKKGFDEFLK